MYARGEVWGSGGETASNDDLTNNLEGVKFNSITINMATFLIQKLSDSKLFSDKGNPELGSLLFPTGFQVDSERVSYLQCTLPYYFQLVI